MQAMRKKYDVLSKEAPSEGAAGPQGRWREVSLRRSGEVAPLVEGVVAEMTGLGYPPRDCLGAGLALEEAIVNGLRHGNREDPTKQVRVRYRVTSGAVLAEVEDEGRGFDPGLVPDPTLPENLDRPSGRGLFLMRHYMDRVCFCGRGNRVVLYKRRPA
jgi:serine/threonine-protein kinase RsbW